MNTRAFLAAILAVIAGAAVCRPAFGQDQETWRCNVENGRYSTNRQSISPGAHSLTGQIQFHSGQFGDHWSPVAHIAFTDSKLPTNADCFCNGVRASIYPDEPDTVKFFMIFNGKSELIAQAAVGRAITFSLAIDDAGVLTVVIGKTNPVKGTAEVLHPQRDMVHMDCSGGDVSFLNVQPG
jgi:hypothetical protein